MLDQRSLTFQMASTILLFFRARLGPDRASFSSWRWSLPSLSIDLLAADVELTVFMEQERLPAILHHYDVKPSPSPSPFPFYKIPRTNIHHYLQVG